MIKINRQTVGLALAAAALIFAAASTQAPKVRPASSQFATALPTGVLSVTSGNFTSDIKGSDLPVVLDVYAHWCGACTRQMPIFEALSKEFDGLVQFAKFDVDTDRSLAKELKITAMPTLLFFKDGLLIERHTGLLSEIELRKKIKNHSQHQPK